MSSSETIDFRYMLQKLKRVDLEDITSQISTKNVKFIFIGIALGGFIGLNIFSERYLQWIKNWNGVIQMYLFIILTIISLKLSKQSGQIIRDQKSVIERMKDIMYAQYEEPKLSFSIKDSKLIEDSKDQMEVELRIENHGGDANDVALGFDESVKFPSLRNMKIRHNEIRQINLKPVDITDQIKVVVEREGTDRPNIRHLEVPLPINDLD